MSKVSQLNILLFTFREEMPTVTCAVVGCTNNSTKLRKWRKQWCLTHSDITGKGKCTCAEPFTLFPFPKDGSIREKWVQAVNRLDPVTNKRWTPDPKYSRVCSTHFSESKPSVESPIPTLNLGYSVSQKSLQKPRQPPKERPLVQKRIKAQKKLEDLFVDEVGDGANEPTCSEEMDMDPSEKSLDKICQTTTDMVGVESDKDVEVFKLKKKILQLECEIKRLNKETSQTMFEKLLTSDSKVNFYTGLPNLETFNTIFEFMEDKVHKMNYWRGPKYVAVRKIRTPLFHRSPKKHGPKRKLSLKDELLLCLMKIRLGLIHEDLADRFKVSPGTVSSIVTTWLKALAKHLRHLISWTRREYIQAQLPSRISRQYPYLRAIIDCTEIYIERPRDLLMQSHTWSDYKKSNTAKILVAITLRGAFSFVSEAFGGRATDKYIVYNSGFLDLIEPYDQIMADNGFAIQADLLMKNAELVKPPPAKGFEQAPHCHVMATKKVANIRIHVERAIQRLKTFRILSGTFPISMISLLDEVITVCASICNLDRMLIE